MSFKFSNSCMNELDILTLTGIFFTEIISYSFIKIFDNCIFNFPTSHSKFLKIYDLNELFRFVFMLHAFIHAFDRIQAYLMLDMNIDLESFFIFLIFHFLIFLNLHTIFMHTSFPFTPIAYGDIF